MLLQKLINKEQRLKSQLEKVRKLKDIAVKVVKNESIQNDVDYSSKDEKL